MGCACKVKQDRVMKLIPTLKPEHKSAQGIKKYILDILDNVYYLFVRLAITLLAITFAIPFIIVSLTTVILFGKEFSLKLPSNLIHNLKNIEEKYG